MESVATPSAVTHTTPQALRELPVLGDVFRIAFEQSAAGICISALDGSYLHANTAFCQFVGYSLDELRRLRSEERRVGKECRSRWSARRWKKKSRNGRPYRAQYIDSTSAAA